MPEDQQETDIARRACEMEAWYLKNNGDSASKALLAVCAYAAGLERNVAKTLRHGENCLIDTE